MSMRTIARYMTLSRSIDFTREKDRYLQLPERGMQRTVLMTPAQAATFSAACSCRVLGMRAV